jgi:hypothetical protein
MRGASKTRFNLEFYVSKDREGKNLRTNSFPRFSCPPMYTTPGYGSDRLD